MLLFWLNELMNGHWSFSRGRQRLEQEVHCGWQPHASVWLNELMNGLFKASQGRRYVSSCGQVPRVVDVHTSVCLDETDRFFGGSCHPLDVNNEQFRV
jgi:hypothetical protein